MLMEQNIAEILGDIGIASVSNGTDFLLCPSDYDKISLESLDAMIERIKDEMKRKPTNKKSIVN